MAQSCDRGQRVTTMDQVSNECSSEVAIIGLACRFPGAANADEYWRNLRDGVESISFFSDEELKAAGVETELLKDPTYVKAKPIVKGADLFDAAFFRISATEAEMMDPQHRLLLECAWEALECAGYNSLKYKGRIGIYAGTDRITYAVNNILPIYGMAPPKSILQYLTENDKDYLCTRISYKLNLRGPSVTVQTACSTALTAVHLACESLLTGECDIALAGAAAISVPLTQGYSYSEGAFVSPDGHCRSFDAKAKGTVFGSGVGVVALKRLEDAVTDGDCIWAVVKGSAVNNDGALRIGYTAPGVDGQAAVVAEALDVAGVDPETIGYVEAHGSGTPLGDLVEITALNKAFRLHTKKKGFCALGSVKPNIGHAAVAAGAAGLIKTVLSLQHKMLVPSLNFVEPNPKIDFLNSPFFVNTALREWTSSGFPRRAGVSSFGLGGANAHLILEEAPERRPLGKPFPHQLLILSALTARSLEAATDNLVDHLRANPALSLADVSYTLQIGRAGFGHRRMLVCTDIADAVSALAARDPRRVYTIHRSGQNQQEPSVSFLFPGIGDHYPGIAREFYESEETFRQCVDRCCSILQKYLGYDLSVALFPPSSASSPYQKGLVNESSPKIDLRRMLGRDNGDSAAVNAVSPLNQSFLAQPAVFVIEYAMAQLLMGWGIQPKAMIGYSLGEYVAACLAGVISLEDSLRVVARRAQMIQSLEPGAMMTVAVGETDLRPWLTRRVAVSGVLTPSLSVLAGEISAISEVEKQLTARGIACHRLPTTHALHSPMMAPISESLVREMEAFSLQAPKIPYLSNVTGEWMQVADATDPRYWSKHLCQTVQFSSGVAALLKLPNQVLLEVGPGQSLGSFVRQHPSCDASLFGQILPTLRYRYDQQSDREFLLKTIGKLWMSGVEIDWEQYSSQDRRQRLPLPTYSFDRERFWLEPGAIAAKPKRPAEDPTGKKRKDISGWFYYPVWKQTQPLKPLEAAILKESRGAWILFLDKQGCGSTIAKRLEAHGHTAFCVVPGSTFEKLGEGFYALDPCRPDDYQALLEALPHGTVNIIHSWAIDPVMSSASPAEQFSEAQKVGFYSLVSLTSALGHGSNDFTLWCLTCNMQPLPGERAVHPEQAPVVGVCRVIPQENLNGVCRCIDVAWPPETNAQAEWVVDQLVAEFLQDVRNQEHGGSLIAYRGIRRWQQDYEPANLSTPTPNVLRHRGVYLITGGLGAIGMILARHLAESFRARLILTTRSTFPSRESWPEWLFSHGSDDSVSCKIREFQKWESQGAEIKVVQADAVDEAAMAAAVEQFGVLHGVIHAAGVVSGEVFRSVRDLSKEQCEPHFAAKAYGLYVLEKVLAGRELDFCILFSSLSPVLGGLGLGAYAAANAFIDLFVYAHNCSSSQWWLSVNWDSWHTRDHQHGVMGSTVAEFEMSPAEALEAFTRALANAKLGQLVNSTGNLQARIDQWVGLSALRSATSPISHKRPELLGSYVAPTNEIEQRVAEIWQQFLGIAPIGIHDNFFELGGQSLMALQIVSRFREVFQMDLQLTAFVGSPTVGEMAKVIASLGHKPMAPTWSSLVCLQNGGSKHPFFCIHPVGGNVLCYASLAHALDQDRPFYGLQARGLHPMQMPDMTIGHMATHYISEIESVQSTGPYLLGGWSLGGLIAFEIAQQLMVAGQNIALLAMFDTALPEQIELQQAEADKAILWQFALDLGLSLDQVSRLQQDASRLEIDAQLRLVLQEAKSNNLLPPDVGLSFIRSLFDVFAANVTAIFNYRPRFYKGIVTLFKAEKNLFENNGIPPIQHMDSIYGWGNLCAGVDAYTVPGDHYTMIREPNVGVLAQRLNHLLNKIKSGWSDTSLAESLNLNPKAS